MDGNTLLFGWLMIMVNTSHGKIVYAHIKGFPCTRCGHDKLIVGCNCCEHKYS